MSAATHAIDLESTWLCQAAFLLALTFLVSYTALHPWWHTVHGRALGLLAIGAVGTNLPVTLRYWHILPPTSLHRAVVAALTRPTDWGWFAEQFRVLFPLVFLILLWQLWSPHLMRSWFPAVQQDHPTNRGFRPSEGQ